LERGRNPGSGVRGGSLLLMETEPAPELRFLLDVRVKARDPLPDGPDAVQDRQVKISRRLRPGDLPLGSNPGKIAVGAGPADLLVRVPDALETASVQGTKRRDAVFIEAAVGAALCVDLIRPLVAGKKYGTEKVLIHRRAAFPFGLP